MSNIIGYLGCGGVGMASHIIGVSRIGTIGYFQRSIGFYAVGFYKAVVLSLSGD